MTHLLLSVAPPSNLCLLSHKLTLPSIPSAALCSGGDVPTPPLAASSAGLSAPGEGRGFSGCRSVPQIEELVEQII